MSDKKGISKYSGGTAQSSRVQAGGIFSRFSRSLGAKLTLAFLAAGLIPLIVIGLIAVEKASSALEAQAFNQLTALRDVKKNGIEEVGNGAKGLTDRLAGMTAKFAQLTKVTGGGSRADYEKAFVAETGEFYKKFKESTGVYDIFLVDTDGYVFYTAAKEPDYQSNVISGQYKDTNFSKLVRDVLDKGGVHNSDFEPYAPSKGEAAAFAAAPVVVNGKTIMVAAIQLPLDGINHVMQERSGMGKTGETYLVGPDKLMRSDSFLDQTNHTVKASFANPAKGKVDTEGAREALAGKTGAKIIIDYNGNRVLSAYAPVKFGGDTWAILAEIDEDEAFAPITSLKWAIFAVGLAGLAAIVAFALFISRSITRPVTDLVGVIKEVAEGDFTREVPVTSHDEIGVMGETFNGMVEELRGIFGNLGQNSKSLAASSEELSAVSTQLSASSEQMSQQSAGVASATEQMSANINSMASAVEESSVNANTVSGTAEQMSANMRSIAASVEEMSQSIREVAKSADETSKVAGEAMGLSKNASDTMQTLGAAANEIGKVTEMIKRIAEQTNLLALNATIEAASAGEAGRGFAVVANEIKQLANQSARAAEEIAAKIDGVRGSTTSAVKVIADVSNIIGKINASVGAITGAVNQQTAAANEISRNVSEVSKGAVDIASSIAEVAKGATEISRNSGEAARGANEVSSNIQGISKAVVDNNSGIRQINSSSGELANMAGSMQEMIARFKVETNGNGHKRRTAVVAAGEDY